MRQLLFLLFSISVTQTVTANITLDGTLSAGEWAQAVPFDLEYEVMPSRNTPANLKTTGYGNYDEKNL